MDKKQSDKVVASEEFKEYIRLGKKAGYSEKNIRKRFEDDAIYSMYKELEFWGVFYKFRSWIKVVFTIIVVLGIIWLIGFITNFIIICKYY